MNNNMLSAHWTNQTNICNKKYNPIRHPRHPTGHLIGTCTGSTSATSAVSFSLALGRASRASRASSVFEDLEDLAEVMALSGEPGTIWDQQRRATESKGDNVEEDEAYDG